MVSMVFAMVDTNGDGKMDLDEICHVMGEGSDNFKKMGCPSNTAIKMPQFLKLHKMMKKPIHNGLMKLHAKKW